MQMRAVVAERYGGPEVLRVAHIARPAPGPGEVLVKVVAAATNPVDAEVRAGAAAGWFDDGPWVWGWDICGTVVDSGPDAVAFPVGRRVVGMPRFPQPARAYAEYVAAPVAHLAPAPRRVVPTVAAALPLRGLTALQVLDLAGVTAEQRVLVNGASGGVGHMAVQLAVDRGAVVTGVAGSDRQGFVRALGAREVLDRNRPMSGRVSGFDVVVDCVGDDGLVAVVRPGGVLAPVPGAARGASSLETAAADRGVRVVRHVVRPDGVDLRRLVALVDAGRLVPEVGAVLPLDEAVQAHRLLDGHGRRGAIVLQVTNEDASCA